MQPSPETSPKPKFRLQHTENQTLQTLQLSSHWRPLKTKTQYEQNTRKTRVPASEAEWNQNSECSRALARLPGLGLFEFLRQGPGNDEVGGWRLPLRS
jgi:hypothetical protein